MSDDIHVGATQPDRALRASPGVMNPPCCVRSNVTFGAWASGVGGSGQVPIVTRTPGDRCRARPGPTHAAVPSRSPNLTSDGTSHRGRLIAADNRSRPGVQIESESSHASVLRPRWHAHRFVAGIIRCINHALGELGLEEVADERLLRMIGAPLTTIFEAVLGSSDVAVARSGGGRVPDKIQRRRHLRKCVVSRHRRRARRLSEAAATTFRS